MSDRNVFSNRRGVWTPSNPRSRLPPVEKEVPKVPTLNLKSTDDFPSLSATTVHAFRPIPDFKAAAAKGIEKEKISQTQAYNKNVSEIPIVPIIRRYKPSVKQMDMSIYDDPIEGGFSDHDEEIVKINRRSHNTDSTKFTSTVRLRIQQARNFEGKPLDQEDLEKSNTPPYGPGPDDDF
jgi:hypothetical protein